MALINVGGLKVRDVGGRDLATLKIAPIGELEMAFVVREGSGSREAFVPPGGDGFVAFVLGKTPDLSAGRAGVRFSMLIQVHRKLGAVNSDVGGWLDQVHEHIQHGTNFLLILRKDRDALKKFCNAFELEDDCHPRILSQGEFFLMSQYVEPGAFDAVLHHWDDNHQVVFVEQIDFLMNRPPRLKHFIVYSPVLGILAQHERLSGAKEILEDYENESAMGTPNPEAGVYHWERGKWQLFEGR